MKLTTFLYEQLSGYRIYGIPLFIIMLLAGIDIALAPYTLKILIDRVEMIGDNHALLLSAIAFPAIGYVLIVQYHNFVTRLYDYLTLKFFPTFRQHVTVQLFEYLSGHSAAYFQQFFSGNLSSKVTDIADGVESIIKTVVEVILIRLATIFVCTIVLASVHWVFSVILLSWIIIYVANGYRLAQQTAITAKDYAESASRLQGFIVDSVSNIASTKLFSNARYETERVEVSVEKLVSKDRVLRWHMLKVHNQQNIIYTALIGGLMAALLYYRIQNIITVGDFAFVFGVSISIAGMVNGFTQAIPTLTREIGKCQQALNTIYLPHDIKDEEDAPECIIRNGEIKFEKVTFSYPHSSELFSSLNLKIVAGQKVGLVGHSGGGKSTFVNLVLRLYEVTDGKILIDNQDIKKVKKDSLRQQIAMIPQQPELFHRTVMENIRYGNLDASNEQVIEAAKRAGCHEFISQLERGYESLVGDRGIKLSGGQRQRIAIARALLKESKILILDEATSALDSVTEKEIQESLTEAMKDKTVIVIAHRLSTLKAMDRILYFKDGHIIEDGTIESLTNKKDGYFKKLWDMQMNGTFPESIT